MPLRNVRVEISVRVSFGLVRFFFQAQKEGGGNWQRSTRQWGSGEGGVTP